MVSLSYGTCSTSWFFREPDSGTKLSRIPNHPVCTVTHSGSPESSLR